MKQTDTYPMKQTALDPQSGIIVLDHKLIEERDYWLNLLSVEVEPISLRPDYPRPRVHSPRMNYVEFEISGDSYQRLTQLTGNGSFLTYATLMAALKVCLFKYTRKPVIIVGSPARKQSDGVHQVANALAIVDTVDGRQTFRELLLQVRQTLLDAYSRQTYPYHRLVSDLKKGDGFDRRTLFDIVLRHEDIHTELPELNNEITITFVKRSSSLAGRIEFDESLFVHTTIKRFSTHYLNMLQASLKNTSALIADLSILNEEQREQVINGFNATAAAYDNQTCIHELIEQQVARSPEATAVVYESTHLSYADLNARANRLAHYLRARGVGPETVVAIGLERSPELLVAMLGTLKAGAAYLPLDREEPVERLAGMLRESGAMALIGEAEMLARLAGEAVAGLELAAAGVEIAVCPSENPASGVEAENLAYAIYTSGSSGKPKGVMMTHRGICNRLQWMREGYPLSADDRLLQKTPMSFDASVWELFLPLMSGAAVVVAREGGERESGYLVEEIRRQGVTVLQMVPTMWKEMVKEEGWNECKSLRAVYSGGEMLSWELAAALKGWQGRRVVNLYGPTGTAIVASYWEVGEEEERRGRGVWMGRPIGKAAIYIADEVQEEVGIGVIGEIYIGGEGLARGYVKDGGQTGGRFVPNSFSKEGGERLYRSGDLGRWEEEGRIEYIGREDQQVKVRGQRVEIGEIEEVMKEARGVKEGVVVVLEQEGGEKWLVGYVVAEKGEEVSEVKMREYMSGRLPEYMVPRRVMVMEGLPVGRTWRLDLRAPPIPDHSGGDLDTSYAAPCTWVEQKIAEIWKGVLGVEEVGINDNFFDLGGHSLLATQVISRLRGYFQVEVALRLLFESPTIAGLAKRLEAELSGAGRQPAPPITARPLSGEVPALDDLLRELSEADSLSPRD